MAYKLAEREDGGWATSQVTVRVVRNSASSPDNNIESHLQKPSTGGNREKLLDVLVKSPDIEPDEADRISQ